MTNATEPGSDWLNSVRGLPDPVADRQFYAGVPVRRLFAFLIDVTLVWAALFVIGVLTLGVGFLLFGLIPFIDTCYRFLTISDRSATFGMRAMRIELRNENGDRLSPGQAFGHTVLFYVSITFFLVHLVSIFMMAGSSLGRALHDLPFGSTMINSPE